jgi:single-strand DNA-binding protein
VAEQYLKKGSSVFIEGRIKNNKWTDKAGIERYGVEVTCENLQMLGIHQQVKANDNIDTQESSISGIRTNNLLVSEIHPTNTFDEEDFPF